MAIDVNSLPIWQRGAYLQRCSIYRQGTDPNSDSRGKPASLGWSTVDTGVPYFHLTTQNFSQPSDIGRIVQPSMISVEFGYFPALVDLKDQDMIRDTTPGGGIAGNVYRVLGAQTVNDAVPVPDAAYSYVELRQEPKPPVDLPA